MLSEVSRNAELTCTRFVQCAFPSILVECCSPLISGITVHAYCSLSYCSRLRLQTRATEWRNAERERQPIANVPRYAIPHEFALLAMLRQTLVIKECVILWAERGEPIGVIRKIRQIPALIDDDEILAKWFVGPRMVVVDHNDFNRNNLALTHRLLLYCEKEIKNRSISFPLRKR